MNTVTEAGANVRVHRWLASMLFIAGALLMAFKIVEDSEPGLVPLVLVAASIGWFAISMIRARRRRAESGAHPGSSDRERAWSLRVARLVRRRS